MDRHGDDERHSDDELASALEAEVARITSAIPIIVTRPAETGLEAAAEESPEPAPEARLEEDDEPDPGPPTQLISWEDLPVPRRPSGPEPTFSPWVATAAIPIQKPAEPEEHDEPERDPEPQVPPISRAEPLGLVPADLAPRDSEPIPVLPELPVTPPEPEPSVVAVAVADDHDLLAAKPRHRIDDETERDDQPEAEAAPASSAPAPTSRVIATGATRVVEAVAPPAFVAETVDLEPTPLDRRVGRASRMFWLWFAATSSLVSIGVGATLFSLGMSLRQLLVATLVGIGLSFLPLGLGTLAGKWSGQPTMVLSRATFGLLGNAVPAVLALLTKLFWGALLLWLAGSGAGAVWAAAGWGAGRLPATIVAVVVAIAVAGVIAFFGYGLVARVQLVLTIASAVLIALMIAATWRHVDVARALAVPDSLWTHVVTGAVLVFTYVGLAWAMSSAEVARYQRPRSSGGVAMLWATFGAGVPPFVLVSYGGLLAASDPSLARRLAGDPVATIAGLGLPAWYPIPLLLAVELSLVSALVLTSYSAGFTVDALGVRLGRRWSTATASAAVGVVGILLALTVTDLATVIRGVPTALAVPVAAWAGIFSGETMLRLRRFHQPSLLRRGGVYPDWRWTNLVMLVVASAIGLGLVSSPLSWLAWEGYLFRFAGIDPRSGIGSSNIGVVVALVLGLLTAFFSALPAVRRQERARS